MSDCLAIRQKSNSPVLVLAYRHAVAKCADKAFRMMLDLALEFALNLLLYGHSEGLVYLLHPLNKTKADAYHAAFDTAMWKMHPDIPADALIHPTIDSVDEELFIEFGMQPVKVSSKAWEVMEASGVYITLEKHAHQVLLFLLPVGGSKSLERLRVAIFVVALGVPGAC
ncbi:hypothetical protein B0H13DRAFT_1874580 [Mycena leptocephala]|nr:hypothetical protein B0H13DRAFT_1874580 [Mycena leptocephala]